MATIFSLKADDMTNLPLPYDPAEGTPVPCLHIDEHTALAVLSIGQLFEYVPDPIASEDPRRLAADPVLQDYAALRNEVQRLVEGAKAKNAKLYARYLTEGLSGGRPWMVPPITLYHPAQLQRVDFPGHITALLLPYGEHLVAIDGETQRIGWQLAALEDRSIVRHKVAVVVHHGIPVTSARQGFYDLNTREVKPNAAVAISMDTQDPATRITRAVIDASDVIRDYVHLRRRQLRRSDPQKLTISALRTGVVTTILGAPGLQAGSRPIELPETINDEQLEAAVVAVWTEILDVLAEELEPDARKNSVVSAPAVLAGIGILAHHAMPREARRDDEAGLLIEDVVDRLDGVNWHRDVVLDGETISPWEGIAGKRTPTGRFSIGGPKEVGNTVAQAIEQPTSDGGKQIRM